MVCPRESARRSPLDARAAALDLNASPTNGGFFAIRDGWRKHVLNRNAATNEARLHDSQTNEAYFPLAKLFSLLRSRWPQERAEWRVEPFGIS